MQGGFVRGGPLVLLRIEGMAVFVAALLIYDRTGWTWWMFAALLLVPDVSMLGYLASPKIGATVYNAAHTSILPLGLLGAGLGWGHALAVALWLAHVGLDRMLGYGLKYASRFADTHLGSLAPRPALPQSLE